MIVFFLEGGSDCPGDSGDLIAVLPGDCPVKDRPKLPKL